MAVLQFSSVAGAVMIGALVVDVLAVHRLTRLVTADAVTQPARDVVISAAYRVAVDESSQRLDFDEARYAWKHGDCGALQRLALDDDCPPGAAKLVTCRWCASMWIAAGVVVLRLVMPRWWGPVARGLALSSAGVLISNLEES